MKLLIAAILVSILVIYYAAADNKIIGQECRGGDTCITAHTDCINTGGNMTCSCKPGYTETNKMCHAGASNVMASVFLMMAAFVTSRFL